MHEWALAEAIIAAASQTAEQEKLKKITEIKIKIGELQQVDHDILEFALSQLKPAKFKDVKFVIEAEKAKLKCRACRTEWFFNPENMNKDSAEAIHFVPEIAHAYIKCPKCGSPDFEILKGRGIWLESIKGER